MTRVEEIIPCRITLFHNLLDYSPICGRNAPRAALPLLSNPLGVLLMRFSATRLAPSRVCHIVVRASHATMLTLESSLKLRTRSLNATRSRGYRRARSRDQA